MNKIRMFLKAVIKVEYLEMAVSALKRGALWVTKTLKKGLQLEDNIVDLIVDKNDEEEVYIKEEKKKIQFFDVAIMAVVSLAIVVVTNLETAINAISPEVVANFLHSII